MLETSQTTDIWPTEVICFKTVKYPRFKMNVSNRIYKSKYFVHFEWSTFVEKIYIISFIIKQRLDYDGSIQTKIKLNANIHFNKTGIKRFLIP